MTYRHLMVSNLSGSNIIRGISVDLLIGTHGVVIKIKISLLGTWRLLLLRVTAVDSPTTPIVGYIIKIRDQRFVVFKRTINIFFTQFRTGYVDICVFLKNFFFYREVKRLIQRLLEKCPRSVNLTIPQLVNRQKDYTYRVTVVIIRTKSSWNKVFLR